MQLCAFCNGKPVGYFAGGMQSGDELYHGHCSVLSLWLSSILHTLSYSPICFWYFQPPDSWHLTLHCLCVLMPVCADACEWVCVGGGGVRGGGGGLPIPLFTFCSKLIKSMRMMLCVVWPSSLEAIQRGAWWLLPPPLSSASNNTYAYEFKQATWVCATEGGREPMLFAVPVLTSSNRAMTESTGRRDSVDTVTHTLQSCSDWIDRQASQCGHRYTHPSSNGALVARSRAGQLALC